MALIWTMWRRIIFCILMTEINMFKKQSILSMARLIIGLIILFIISSCSVLKKNSKDDNQTTKDSKRKGKVEVYRNSCYLI